MAVGEERVVGHRVPRVSRLMALAIRFDQLIRDGVVADQAELARLGYVSRARLTQIMNLLCLAPDIQETILFLPVIQKGNDPITERDLRAIVAVANWKRQRRLWRHEEQKKWNHIMICINYHRLRPASMLLTSPVHPDSTPAKVQFRRY